MYSFGNSPGPTATNIGSPSAATLWATPLRWTSTLATHTGASVACATTGAPMSAAKNDLRFISEDDKTKLLVEHLPTVMRNTEA
jgi:hypothetical protein